MSYKILKFEKEKFTSTGSQFIILLFSILVVGCSAVKLKTFDFPTTTDTSTRPINYQEKRVFELSDTFFADNMFDGARLNAFEQLNDSTLEVTILPENEPINDSPHFAFRIWAKSAGKIILQLKYPTSKHRYWPKLSSDGIHWKTIDSTNFRLIDDDAGAELTLTLDQNKLWVAAQELHTSTEANSWAKNLANHPDVKYSTIGKSKLNRDLIGLDLCQGDPKNKDIIVILSRQHPPEVSGYLAMRSFVKELLSEARLAVDFRKKYRILIYPMMNPDGVDLGHWRHNVGGIDLNRDWAYYRQEEVSTVVNHIVKTVNKSRSKVILGLDFHSTQEDLYYSFPDNMHSTIYPFKDYWIQAIGTALPNYNPDDQPYPLNDPISKAWFYKQFEAESITYEIGDETPRDFIKLKAEIGAREMMKLLILK